MNNLSLCGGIITIKHAKGIPWSGNSYYDRGVTDTGAAEVVMAAEEDSTAVMTVAASMTGTGPNTVRLQRQIKGLSS